MTVIYSRPLAIQATHAMISSRILHRATAVFIADTLHDHSPANCNYCSTRQNGGKTLLGTQQES